MKYESRQYPANDDAYKSKYSGGGYLPKERLGVHNPPLGIMVLVESAKHGGHLPVQSNFMPPIDE
jgi:hypothetical protein